MRAAPRWFALCRRWPGDSTGPPPGGATWRGRFAPHADQGSVFAHDFDHDGIPDLAVPGSPIAVFRGAAAAPFDEQHSIPVVRDPLQLAACSLDAGGTVGLATRFNDGAVLYPEVAPWQYGSPVFLASGTKSITPGFGSPISTATGCPTS